MIISMRAYDIYKRQASISIFTMKKKTRKTKQNLLSEEQVHWVQLVANILRRFEHIAIVYDWVANNSFCLIKMFVGNAIVTYVICQYGKTTNMDSQHNYFRRLALTRSAL